MKVSLDRVFWYRVILVTIGLGWGLTVSLATIATSTGFDPLAVTFWSTVLTFVLLTLILLILRRRPPLDARHIRFFALTGFLGTAFPHALTLYVAKELPAGIRAIVFALIPMMTLLASFLLRFEQATIRRLIGISLGFAAVVLLVQPGTDARSTSDLFWIGVALIVSVSYTAENLYISVRRPEGLHPLTALWGMNAVAVGLLFLAMVAMGIEFRVEIGLGEAEVAILAMSVIHIGCYAGLIFLLSHGGAVFGSQVAYIVTPAGIFWGALILSEDLTLTIIISTIMVLTGLAFTQPRAKTQSPS